MTHVIRGDKTEKAIDDALLADRGNSFRALVAENIKKITDVSRQEDQHVFRDDLGVQALASACKRAAWIGWRWLHRPSNPPARLIRLFNRGHYEEPRFLAYMQIMGVKIKPRGPDHELKHFKGFFKTSIDAILKGLPEYPDERILGEFKTHSDKCYKELVESGVRISKPAHYQQMQVLMHLRKIHKTIYIGVNKNDDSIYCEYVEYDEDDAIVALQELEYIIYRPTPPRYHTSIDKFPCSHCSVKFACRYMDVNKTPVNCRTCKFSRISKDKGWVCTKKEKELTPEMQQKGCKHWSRLNLIPKN